MAGFHVLPVAKVGRERLFPYPRHSAVFTLWLQSCPHATMGVGGGGGDAYERAGGGWGGGGMDNEQGRGFHVSHASFGTEDHHVRVLVKVE